MSALKGTRHISKPIMVLIIATTLLGIFIVAALLLVPGPQIPIFRVMDQNGDWDAQAQGKIAVFDDMIAPGSHGEYKFIIKNDAEGDLRFGFKLEEYLNNAPPSQTDDYYAFMEYRLKMDNVPLGDYEWHKVGYYDWAINVADFGILKDKEHLMTLEWRWPFDIDGEHDEKDTLLGTLGGKLSIHIFIWAENVDEGLWDPQ